MNTVAIIIGFLVVFSVGVVSGIVLKKWLRSRKEYDGTINVMLENDKLVYSLELNNDPEGFQYKDELIFKVQPLEE